MKTIDLQDARFVPAIAPPAPPDPDAAPFRGTRATDDIATIDEIKSFHNLPLQVESPYNRLYGNGIAIVTIDSGIDTTHGLFQSRPDSAGDIEQYDFTNSGTTQDFVGHGTAVTGQSLRCARGVGLHSFRVFDKRGVTSGPTLAAALDACHDWMDANPDTQLIVNLSLGTEHRVPALDARCNKLVDDGAIVVAAAGNSGRLGGSPATAEKVFSAGACDLMGSLASFSAANINQGITNPDLTMIGTNCRLARAAETRMGRIQDSDWTVASGTSFSAPLVSGSIAALLSSYPKTDWPTIKQALLDSARDRPETEREGAGNLDYGATDESLHNRNHVPEKTFQEALDEFFRTRYGDSAVSREHYLSSSVEHEGDIETIHHGFADFWIDASDNEVILAVEVANDSDTLWDELKQARKYAMAHERAVPVVVIPKDHDGEPLASYLAERTEAVFRTYDYDPGDETMRLVE